MCHSPSRGFVFMYLPPWVFGGVCVPACLDVCPSPVCECGNPSFLRQSGGVRGQQAVPIRGPASGPRRSRVHPAQLAARGPGRTRRQRVHLTSQSTRPRPPAPGPSAWPPAKPESPRPAHLAAARRTSASSGLAGPGAMRKQRGSGFLRDGEGSSADRMQLRLLPPSAEATIWRRAGAGPGRWCGAWEVVRGLGDGAGLGSEAGRGLEGGAGPG